MNATISSTGSIADTTPPLVLNIETDETHSAPNAAIHRCTGRFIARTLVSRPTRIRSRIRGPLSRSDGEFIDKIVHRVTAMTLNPLKTDLIFRHQFNERLPEVNIRDWFTF